ncbi:DUF4124 domain-containing protein, partial [Pseudomonas umsongensis]
MGRGLLFILLLIALPATAQIYKYTDAQGNTAYSNQPPDGVTAQPVELPPLNLADVDLADFGFSGDTQDAL